ncbi:hypothetical protein PHYBLDRAFT_165342 [Phycomyces blakesleeanus NRRL 1555(-)]|uniref:Homeodomain-like DNA binding domain-containing transcription factor n=1 Tax=Phycomyces blakesleeanus (strain ATCC 8743b / DSM 1359 / FGSC 10004 / NBRC 33097 / NRRL 1555) TaxID=763407 RepID=A0A163E5R7_PHYB8|nr:hypothetical protein PHYBLDRAFT_165342 [Phycomyces blakesleeanus NRRL 1555(-)]OAD76840.1 hypothetical protein PHYBLDRAFT_165342 [Phycomyces blakesleeanus NRRL 1555(-)]|eukprot:XP_018294880.1 hypothetical protein PHYBLDRAFT_165342 [Phycomyces blakesleeanus NRRL 1555(-)]
MWCQTNEKDCLIYDAAMVCKYLSYHHHIDIAKTQLNIDRSAIASVFKVIHSNSLPLANHYLIQVFFKALRNNSQYPARPSTPVWDPEKVLAKILDWGPTGDLSMTEHMRSSMPIDHTLFLGFVEGSQPHSIRPSTMSTWIKTTLSECGVNTTIHKATLARRRGVPVAASKRHANWSANSQVFERYYWRPERAEAAQIHETIFLPTENEPHWRDRVSDGQSRLSDTP